MLQQRLRRVVSFLRRRRLEDELAEEIRLHLELRRQALIDEGLDPREADAAAKRLFGNVTFIREESRAMWTFGWLDTIEQDVRYGVRVLRRTPWFTAVAVLSLAAGIGSAATIFNIADAVLLRELAVRYPGELREFGASISFGADAKHVNGVDPATLQHLRHESDFGDLLGFRVVEDVAVTDPGGEARVVRAEGVTDNYFSVLGVRPAVGRLLGAHDAGTAPLPLVISERLWAAAFSRDRGVLNRSLIINDIPAVLVGVAAGFGGVVADRPADVFLPVAAGTLVDPRTASNVIRILVRLRPGVTAGEAEQKFAALYTATGPSMVRAGELRVRLTDASRGVADAREPLTAPLVIGLVLATLLLLVSCANTGGLLVARFAARQAEFAVRVALGASRRRLIRQLGVEALLLSVAAAAAGVLIATTGAPLLIALTPIGSTPPEFELRFDWRLIGFTAGMAACAAFVAGGVSLLRVTRAQPVGILHAAARTLIAPSQRITRPLIGAQVAASVLLVVGATSMTRTLSNLHDVDPGFDASGALAIRIDGARPGRDSAVLSESFRRLQERLSALPSIARASMAQFGLMSGAATTGTVDIPGFVARSDADRWVRVFWVGPGFFETAGMPVLLGRGIERQDTSRTQRVAVVNERFARFYFGSPSAALGRVVNDNIQIVGVVADAHYDTLRSEPARAIFTPFTQSPSRPAMTFIVRPRDGSSAALHAALDAIRAHDPLMKATVTSLSDQVASTLVRERFLAIVAFILACIGVFLSCAGLYAAVSYATAERRAEFAVRVALGATRQDIVSTVLREPLKVALAGIATGLPGAYVVMRASSALLYGVAPFDLATVGSACMVLIAAATAAALWPALRAARLDPLVALRAQ